MSLKSAKIRIALLISFALLVILFGYMRSQQQYKQQQLSVILNQAAIAKSLIEEFASANKTLPANNIQAGFHAPGEFGDALVRGLFIVDGTIIIPFKNSPKAAVVFIPVTLSPKIKWQCILSNVKNSPTLDATKILIKKYSCTHQATGHASSTRNIPLFFNTTDLKTESNRQRETVQTYQDLNDYDTEEANHPFLSPSASSKSETLNFDKLRGVVEQKAPPTCIGAPIHTNQVLTQKPDGLYWLKLAKSQRLNTENALRPNSGLSHFHKIHGIGPLISHAVHISSFQNQIYFLNNYGLTVFDESKQQTSNLWPSLHFTDRSRLFAGDNRFGVLSAHQSQLQLIDLCTPNQPTLGSSLLLKGGSTQRIIDISIRNEQVAVLSEDINAPLSDIRLNIFSLNSQEGSAKHTAYIPLESLEGKFSRKVLLTGKDQLLIYSGTSVALVDLVSSPPETTELRLGKEDTSLMLSKASKQKQSENIPITVDTVAVGHIKQLAQLQDSLLIIHKNKISQHVFSTKNQVTTSHYLLINEDTTLLRPHDF